MSSISHPPDKASGHTSTGSLSVEVPHWAAEVRLYNDQFRSIDLAAIQESQQAPGRYEAAAELVQGIYEVEVTLAGQSERQLVAVYPNQTVRIGRGTWKRLEFSSAAPLANTATTREWHMGPAEEWSRRITWPEAPGGDSRLFLFVRTVEPERYPAFADGLFLLGADGRLITDFAEGVRKSPKDGWLAFNADLPAGCYILSRRRRGVRMRYQLLYLCADWETQVFVATPRGRPSLRTITFNMANRGAGFRPDDETAVAAQVIFDSLRHFEGDGVIASSDKLKRILGSSRTDPWLSILAAYALLRYREEPGQVDKPSDASGEAELLSRVLQSLAVVEAHPDARAVRLRNDEPASSPFWQPPLLRVGLERVRRNATRYAGTVPLGSLTDCVLDNLVTDSPWTAWRRLDRLPRPEHVTPGGNAGRQMLAHKAPSLADASSYTAAFIEAAPPNTPVYRLAIGTDTGVATAAEEPPALTAPATFGTLLQAPVIQEAQSLTETGSPTTLPEIVSLDPARKLGELLEGVEPEAVSADSGVPLARTTESLDQLRRLCAEAPRPTPDPSAPILTGAEQAILAYALKKTAWTVAGEADPAEEAAPGAEPSTTIEKCVASLRTEADRLLLRPSDEQWKADGGDPETARALGMRLRQVADDLLRRADFVVLIDPDGRLLYGNGAFVQLVSPADDPQARHDTQQERRRGARQQQRLVWEAALASTSPGHSTLTAPISNPISTTWQLSRTVIKDSVDGRPWADLVVFRSKDVPPLDPTELEQVDALLPELTQCSSFFAYGSAEHRTEYIQRLESLIIELQRLVRAGLDTGSQPAEASARQRQTAAPQPGYDPQFPAPPRSYAQAFQQSIADPDRFWGAAAAGIDWYRRPTVVLDRSNPPFYGWFADGTLNTCFNALDRHVRDGRGGQAALIYDSPVTGTGRMFTYRQLLEEVARFAGVLRGLGTGKGDRVVIYMPMIPEAVVAMLACARLGAVHSVVFGGFAARELAARIDDAAPKVVVSASCGIETTRVVQYKPILDRAIELSSSKPERCVILQRPQAAAALAEGRDLDWEQVMVAAEPADCVPVAATDPLYILYTSGTTGKPKGVVRDNGGHAVALRWSMANIYDTGPGEVFWAASDIGWVAGHSYIVYAPLLAGCATVLYEGKPVGTPDAGAFWRVICEYSVKAMFSGPTAFRAIRKEDPAGDLARRYDLSGLRYLFLAGERLDPETYRWAGDLLGIPVIDHWWQTETGWPIAADLMGLEPMPTKPGSPTMPVPGYDLHVVDPFTGEDVPPGTAGDIVLRLPLPPGCLITLWGDDQRFIDSYLVQHPGTYVTGDDGFRDDDGYVYVMGRTDDVINVAGHRLSTGEMEEILVSHPAVTEAAVIGVPDPLKGQVPHGFVVLQAGADIDPDVLSGELVGLVRARIGAVAALRRVDVITALPKTRSGRILRRTMRGVAEGRHEPAPSTIEDPAVLDSLRHVLADEV